MQSRRRCSATGLSSRVYSWPISGSSDVQKLERRRARALSSYVRVSAIFLGSAVFAEIGTSDAVGFRSKDYDVSRSSDGSRSPEIR